MKNADNYKCKHYPSRKSKLIFVTNNEFGEVIKASEGFIKKLGFSEEIEIKASKEGIPENSINVITQNIELFMPFEDLVNLEEEKARLEKEKEKILAEKEKTDKMLGNPGFLAKAPEAKIKEEQEKLAKFNEMLTSIEERLKNM